MRLTPRSPARLTLASAAVMWFGLSGGPALAEDAPSCQRASLGEVACFTSKLCRCIYDRGGAITGIPAGFRWDCGILRPPCGEARVPATLDPEYGPFQYPSAVAIDRSEQNVNVNQLNRNANRNLNAIINRDGGPTPAPNRGN